MCNFIRIALLSVCTVCASASVVAMPDVVSMLQTADDFRLENASSKVVSLVTLYENGEQTKTRRYHVYTRPERESLVVFKSKAEAGQKMLMLGDNYWLLMPKSRRPIRITPMQKLLGEASVGDISTLTWSEDYEGVWVKEESILQEDGTEIPANLLQLKSVTKGASYHRIELWLEKGSDFPLKANLYLRSGKLAKEARYSKGERKGRVVVSAMTLLDKIQPSKKTKIEYQSVEPLSLNDKYYNPAYLSRNQVSDL
ncbi:outer membrane lipoprotein-sorting protein [Vibrio albus]|uniref:Outer membrane lipoprotein-sorting protein n=1 Tax=Vibrio albus TaxID=2200953 RepID=A0A2U3B6R8_9VIBR|nr:outer membrane lipoprotein-sorting protein [Vibrio albus]PWI32489.1 outer membrane lipoprotein-sorting protein [Vibrio albus]